MKKLILLTTIAILSSNNVQAIVPSNCGGDCPKYPWEFEPIQGINSKFKLLDKDIIMHCPKPELIQGINSKFKLLNKNEMYCPVPCLSEERYCLYSDQSG